MRYRASNADRKILRALYIAEAHDYGPQVASELAFASRYTEKHVRARLSRLRRAGLVRGGHGGWWASDAGLVFARWESMTGE